MTAHYGFITELDTRKVKEGNTFKPATHQLLSDLMFGSKHIGLVVVPAGYITDFASVPRLPFAYMLTGGAAQKSATVHDKLCDDWRKTKGKAITWALAAKVFLEAMTHEGVPAWRRHAMYVGVLSYGVVTFKK